MNSWIYGIHVLWLKWILNGNLVPGRVISKNIMGQIFCFNVQQWKTTTRVGDNNQCSTIYVSQLKTACVHIDLDNDFLSICFQSRLFVFVCTCPSLDGSASEGQAIICIALEDFKKVKHQTAFRPIVT